MTALWLISVFDQARLALRAAVRLVDTRFTAARLAQGIALLGAAVLAGEPLLWLIGTWYRPGYEGIGGAVFVAVLALFVWSTSSPLLGARRPVGIVPVIALCISASLRLAGQLLDIDVLGALLLCVDVYVLAHLAGLSQRRRALSPFWLAVLFCFALPIEPLVQRLLGYALQHVSAWLACGLLTPFTDGLVCAGLRLAIDERDVLVDLPCSGAQILSLCALIFAGVNALRPLRLSATIVFAAVAATIALLGNALRVAVLALGIAHGETLGVDVMAPVPHNAIGMIVVAAVAVALMAVSAALARYSRPCPPRAASGRAPTFPRESTSYRSLGSVLLSVCFLTFALLVSALQPRPVDVSPRLLPPEVPPAAAGFFGVSKPLTPREQRYFTQFGGGAERIAYGPFGLLLVATESPLRHLHDPTICLRGNGFDVRLLGTDHSRATTVYAATGPSSSAAYAVHVSYVSDRGGVASSVSEVVWHWLVNGGGRWTMVQRIFPLRAAGGWSALGDDAYEFDSAMRRAYEIHPSNTLSARAERLTL